MFMSPSIIVLADVVQNDERRLYISGMKAGFGLGGRQMRSTVVRNGGLHLNAQHSKEGS